MDCVLLGGGFMLNKQIPEDTIVRLRTQIDQIEKEIEKLDESQQEYVCPRCMLFYDQPGNCISCYGKLELRIDAIVSNKQYIEELQKKILNFENQFFDKTNDFGVVWEKDLENIKIEPFKWLIQGLIPSKSIVVLGGKRASFKSWAALQMAIAVSSASSALGVFNTEQVPVLYIDEENGIDLIKQRVSMLKKGSNIQNNLNIAFTSFSNLRLTREEDIRKLKDFIKTNAIKLIIIDSFKRVFHTYDENKAEEISKIFTDILRPITEEYGVSWLLLHHLKKGFRNQSTDEMDMLRGSSELVNYVDAVIVFQRKNDSEVILKQPKMRKAVEISSKVLKFDISDKEGVAIVVFEGELEELSQSDTAIEKCSNAILEWIFEANMKEFETALVKAKMKELHSFSEATVGKALKNLVETKKLDKESRGLYKLTENDEQTKL